MDCLLVGRVHWWLELLADWDIGRLIDCEVKLRKRSMSGGVVSLEEFSALKTGLADVISALV